MKRILHAPNVHQGGGRTLLVALLRALAADPDPCLAIVDARLALPDDLPPTLRIVRVPPAVHARLAAEIRLRRACRPDSVVLCFGNLPPLFALPGRIRVFLQNRYLVAGGILRSALPIRVRLRLLLERIWLRTCLRTAEVIVQTASMKREADRQLGTRAVVRPFTGSEPGGPTPDGADRRHDFVYVASGEPHKNHRALVEAWALLADRSHRPSLCLTLDPARFPDLVAWIEGRSRAHALRIVNAGTVDPDRIWTLYAASKALIHPSFFESFGLPLVEAVRAGIPVLAGELDYVRDLLDPAQTFDPSSPVSIARAVERHLGFLESKANIATPEEFIDEIFQDKAMI